MKIAIDATNLKAGGGLSHLKQLSKQINSQKNVEVHLIGGIWLKEIESDNKHIFADEFSTLIKQETFKNNKLPKLLKTFDIVFAPGGSFFSKTIPYVTMCRNMLVFEEKERNRFPKSFTWLRYLLLEKIQVRSFKHSSGIIYISQYAKNYVEQKYPILKFKKSTVIYHGISDDFRQVPKPQKSITEYTSEKPYKLLYVSIINYYKHQWNVVKAVKLMREKGYPIELELVGPMEKTLEKKMCDVLKGSETYIKYKGKIPYEEIAASYKSADMFIFASTCENMPNILVEAMSAGLPIVCSDFGPMPEILKDGGVYINPTQIESIVGNLEKILNDPSLREEIAQKAYRYSLDFSWKKTANDTMNFIKQIHTTQ